MIEIILIGVLLYIAFGSSEKGNSKGCIKYDKRMVRICLCLTVISILAFLLSLILLNVGVDVIRYETWDEVLLIIATNGMGLGLIGTFASGYQSINGFFYLRRLKKMGYHVPEDKRVYEGLVSLLPNEGTEPSDMQEDGSYEAVVVPEPGEVVRYSPTSRILLYLSIFAFLVMLGSSGYYLYKWHFMGENAMALFVLQLIADAFWLIIIRIFYKQMDNAKYRDDVEIDITRKVRMNMVSGLTLYIVILLVAIYIKMTVDSMTEYSFKSGWIKDQERMIEIHSVFEVACCEREYFYPDSREWQETQEILAEGVDITDWGNPQGEFQEDVAAMLDITNFEQLKWEFCSTDGPAVVFVRREGEKIIVELQNLYPVADEIVISQ